MSVGKTLLHALQLVWQLLISPVTRLLNTALAPYLRRARFQRTRARVRSRSFRVRGRLESNRRDDIRTRFLLAIALSVALNIVKGVGFGSEFLVSILIGLILSVGLTALQYLLPGITSPSPQMVTSLQTFSNNYWPQTAQAPNWTSMSSAFSYWENGASDTYAFTGLTSLGRYPECRSMAVRRASVLARLRNREFCDGVLCHKSCRGNGRSRQ